ncbi:MAG: alpha/beta fold hydrolase [Anaerolineae bacterium]|jgi:long-chain acyl-CoA synthetase|nr:alpha/beta fold hydrolase [Anaerolineae bacterium]
MKRQLRGIKRQDIQLDFNLYRRDVPIKGIAGAKLSVIDMQPEAVKQTIMFVHGYAGCAETWEFQINHFVKKYRVVIPDLRGHGQSDAPYSQYTMSEIVEDLQTIVEHLNLPERFVLVGHSFGGSICIEYANACPERLEKLVLVATAGEYPLPRAAIWAYLLPTAFYQLWWKYRPRWNADIHVMKRLMLNNLRKWKGWSLVRNIQTETLVITGERDTFFPRYVFDDIGTMIPNGEVYDVGSAKHKVQLERHEAVNRAIERFIDTEHKRKSWRDLDTTEQLLKKRPWVRSYSKDTPLTIPIPRQPLFRFLESAANWTPKRIATIFRGEKLTYEQLEDQVNRFAHALQGLGVRPGDRVFIVLPNSPQLIIAYYATLKIGSVVVMPNPDAQISGILGEIRQVNAQVMITLKQYSELAQAAKQHSTITSVIFTDLHHQTLSPDERRELKKVGSIMESMIEIVPEGTPPPEVKVQPEDLAVIVFTSGTTDEPKGVCLTHYNLVANTLQTRHWVPDLIYGQETCLTVLPLLHSYGMTTAMNVPIALAATIVLLPVFELQEVLEHIKKYKPTIFPGVPSIYTAINHAPNVRSYGLSSIKACISGAAPLPVEVQEEFEKLTRGRLVEGYGLSECSPITHANPLYGTRKIGSIGVPLPNTEAKIVDLITHQDLPANQIGELVVRGPQVMQGYWGDHQGEVENPESIIRNGWLYTGDVAVMDDDGYFQIISRKRDTIMAGEYSVYPRDVEEVLYENSKVLEVAVVGIALIGQGQKVKAFVVPRPGTKLSKEELIQLCRRRLEEYAVPWDIEFREELPKSFVGKVLRRMLVDQEPSSRS